MKSKETKAEAERRRDLLAKEGKARLVAYHLAFIARLTVLYPDSEYPGMAERMAAAGREYVKELKAR